MHILFSILALLSAVLTAVLYWFGLERFFFWYYPWFDTPLHLVGGLTIGLWGASLAWRRGYSRYRAFIFILLLALAIGLTWELFEYVYGLTAEEGNYWSDTLGDLGNDVIGALVPWVLYSIIFRPKNPPLE
jgi:hypothetical protein